MTRRHTRTVDERLASTELFAGLTRRELQLVSANTTELRLPAGRVLLREGTAGRQMIVIESGQAAVTAAGEPIAVLGSGAHAGEIALLTGTSCTATATSITPVVLQVISARELDALLAAIPVLRTRLWATAAERVRALPPHERAAGSMAVG